MPSGAELRAPGWLPRAIRDAAAATGEDGLIYAAVPRPHRPRAATELRRAGFGAQTHLAQFPAGEPVRYLVPVQDPVWRYALTSVIAARPAIRRLLAAAPDAPLGHAALRLVLPAVGILARRRPSPLPWVSALGSAADGVGQAVVATSFRGERGATVLHCFGEGAQRPWGVVKVAPGATGEDERLAALGAAARAAGARVPAVLGRAVGGRTAVAETVVAGRPAADVLSRAPERLGEVVGAVAAWLERWSAATAHAAGAGASRVTTQLLDDAAALAPLLPDGDAYRRRLADRCASLGDRELPLVAGHNDLTMWNVVLQTGGPIGVLDWGEAEAQAAPLADFVYAVADATAASQSYRSRLEAVRRSFPTPAVAAGPAAVHRNRLLATLGLSERAAEPASTPAGCTTRAATRPPRARTASSWPSRGGSRARRRRPEDQRPYATAPDPRAVAVPPAPGGGGTEARTSSAASWRPWPRSTTSACCTCAPRASPGSAPVSAGSSRSWRRSAVPTASPAGGGDSWGWPTPRAAWARAAPPGPATGGCPRSPPARPRSPAGWRPDVIQAEFHVMGQYLEPLRPYGALVLVEHEPGAAAARDRAAVARGPERAARRVDARAWRRYEHRILTCADAVVAFTERDRGELTALAGEVPVARIPFGADLPAEPLDPLGTDPPRIVFVGNLNHPPNAQAALDLVHGIAPAVRRQRPDAVVEVVGEAPRALARRLRGPGVVVAGVVADVGPHLDRAAVVAVPARLGGGMRVKVVQTLAAGKALVATAAGSRGPRPRPREQALVAETDDELAAAIVGLLDDPEQRRALGRAARAWADAHLRWTDVLASYGRLYASLEGSARR